MKQLFKKLLGTQSQQLSVKSEANPRSIRWVLPDCLAVGPIPDAQIYQQLSDGGLKAVLTLCAESEGELYHEVPITFTWQRLVLPDSHYQEKMQADQIATAVEIIHQNLSEGRPTYVHCLAGMERSPSICIAYLCRHQNMPLWEAVQWVKQKNPRTSITSHQMQTLQSYSQSGL